MMAHPTMLLHHTVSDFVLRMALRQLTSSEGKLSVARTAVLKHTLRSIHRMMQSSGTSEGLRGLLDSSLLKSVKKIMQLFARIFTLYPRSHPEGPWRRAAEPGGIAGAENSAPRLRVVYSYS